MKPSIVWLRSLFDERELVRYSLAKRDLCREWAPVHWRECLCTIKWKQRRRRDPTRHVGQQRFQCRTKNFIRGERETLSPSLRRTVSQVSRNLYRRQPVEAISLSDYLHFDSLHHPPTLIVDCSLEKSSLNARPVSRSKIFQSICDIISTKLKEEKKERDFIMSKTNEWQPL